MNGELVFEDVGFETRAISPFKEIGAYEALWDESGASFKTISEKISAKPGAVPSDFVPLSKARDYATAVLKLFSEKLIKGFGIRVHGAGEYPQKLRDAAYPIELLYYQGWWDLIDSRCVAVVGARNPSKEGLARVRKLVRRLVEDDFTVVSGLAKGVDTEAHNTAISIGGRTIAVIGTPISHVYPKENRELQKKISEQFLLISQVPVFKYEKQTYEGNRFFFPERNKTMSALTEATIIVEAGETSGTLIQARAALQQGRKLFILENCFRNKELTWPRKFAEKGAIRVRDYDDIKRHLSTKVNEG